jgi:hypothetical protein
MVGTSLMPSSLACAYQEPRPYDFVTESPNVGHDGRTDIPLLEGGCRALQV